MDQRTAPEEKFPEGKTAGGGGESSTRSTASKDKGKAKESSGGGRDEPAEPDTSFAIQLILNLDAGTISEMHSEGRPPSPFSGTQGAHRTAWTVLLEEVRVAIVNRAIPAAAQEVTTLANKYRTQETQLSGLGSKDEASEKRGSAWNAMGQYPGDITDAPPAVQPLLLQSYVKTLLTYVNLIPGATADVADTSGHGEGRHKKILNEHRSGAKRHPPEKLQTAIFGLLEIPSEENYDEEQEKDAVKKHLEKIRNIFPGVVEAAGITDDGWEQRKESGRKDEWTPVPSRKKKKKLND